MLAMCCRMPVASGAGSVPLTKNLLAAPSVVELIWSVERGASVRFPLAVNVAVPPAPLVERLTTLEPPRTFKLPKVSLATVAERPR